MFCVAAEATRWLRGGALNLAGPLAVLTIVGASADARPAPKLVLDNPRYAAIVVDANTGSTLRQSSADALRHPASLTKIMTLYLLFERLEAGKIKLNTQLLVSAQAAAQDPTKLGLKHGQTIAVEDAIKALVTKSANDVAVVVAEALGGTEEDFAVLMTRKARALGMTRTVYRNASGLPDDGQVTTARDQARLGIAIQEQFPRYYRYFSLTSFTYHGETMLNHNKLLGRVSGVDGIKTGYTHASGYNLVSSVRRGARHIVAVVMGGETGAQRDANMRDLIDRFIVAASDKRPEVKVAQPAAPVEPKAEAPARPKPRIVIVPIVPSASDATASITPPPPPSASDPINPTVVRTVPIRASVLPIGIPQVTAFAPTPELSPPAIEARRLPGPAEKQATAPEETETAINAMGAISEPPVTTEPAATPQRPAALHSGWAIQVGAFEQEDEAKQRLGIAKSKAAQLLSTASPYTERTTKGDKTFYRARFAGLDRVQAEAICKVLQRNDVACMALKM